MCCFLELIGQNHDGPHLETDKWLLGDGRLNRCYPETWPLSLHVPSPFPPSLPPFLPQLQRPHRLRCFTQPMKCLKDTESVSPHGHGFLSAGLPGGTHLYLSMSCMHSSSTAWIYWWPDNAHVQSTKQQLQKLSTRSHTWRPRASVLSYMLFVSAYSWI